MKKNELLMGALLALLLIGLGGYYVYTVSINDQQTENALDSAATLQTNENTDLPLESYPDDISNPLPDEDSIRLSFPLPNQVITSPLTITGEARGNWFFEASFPVVLTNWDGLIIAEGIATAQDDWMTEDFVPFEATLKFEEQIYSNKGSLILKKDNPSGLPENDDALEIPVLIGTNPQLEDLTEEVSDIPANINESTNTTNTPDLQKPPIVDHFACSDYCPGPREQYMVKIYEGVEDEEECRNLGGTPSTYTGWGTFNICIAE